MVQNVNTMLTNMNRTLVVTWDAVPLIMARRFINYTVTLLDSSSKRQALRIVTVQCCRHDFDNVDPGLSYTVEVEITGFPLTVAFSSKHIVWCM